MLDTFWTRVTVISLSCHQHVDGSWLNTNSTHQYSSNWHQ